MAKTLIIIVLIIIISLGAGGLFIRHLLSPVKPSSQTTVVFVVSPGESTNSVAQALTDQSLIWSPWSLKIASHLSGKGKNIQAGSFRLSAAMTPNQILDTLAHGKLDIWVTLLEGWRREEMADGLAKTFSDNHLNFDKTKFLAATEGKEGYLFPDTYLFPINSSEAAIANVLASTFTKKLTPTLQSQITASGHSEKDIVIMASIVEREARTPESRRIVAGILWKRLSQEWPLQVDATLQYAKGFDKINQTWWSEPQAADKDINSPYNTYKNIGLPPTPICAPSLSSIQASISPETTPYWYYLTDSTGQMHYATTMAEHQQNITKYLK